MFDRQFHMMEIVKYAKQTPGVATYHIDGYDERFVKPPKNGKSDKAEKYTYVDEILFYGKQKPGIYDPIDLVSLFFIFIFIE